MVVAIVLSSCGEMPSSWSVPSSSGPPSSLYIAPTFARARPRQAPPLGDCDGLDLVLELLQRVLATMALV